MCVTANVESDEGELQMAGSLTSLATHSLARQTVLDEIAAGCILVTQIVASISLSATNIGRQLNSVCYGEQPDVTRRAYGAYR